MGVVHHEVDSRREDLFRQSLDTSLGRQRESGGEVRRISPVPSDRIVGAEPHPAPLGALAEALRGPGNHVVPRRGEDRADPGDRERMPVEVDAYDADRGQDETLSAAPRRVDSRDA